MQCSQDFSCTECSHKFDSAASLLQHFATHVLPRSESGTKDSGIFNKSLINDEYSEEQFENEKSSDSGIEDINPLKLCLVTIDENQLCKEGINDEVHPENLIEDVDLNTMKKYRCCFCQKKFGWPTDLKRHILIHTGERPFKCDLCDSSFTRNFILQKHRRKMHPSESKPKMPALKPIGAVTRNRKISTKFSTPN